MNDLFAYLLSAYHWYFFSGVLLLAVLGAWMRIRRTMSYGSCRPMNWLSMVSVNFILLYGGIITILRHPEHQLLGAISWGIALLLLSSYSFYKAMQVHIKLDENNNILVPVFFFRLMLFVIIPYVLIYAPLLVYNPKLYHFSWFILITMSFKGCIAGIYLGSCVASIYQVYERDMPAPKDDK